MKLNDNTCIQLRSSPLDGYLIETSPFYFVQNELDKITERFSAHPKRTMEFDVI